jgi:hypothetical protein
MLSTAGEEKARRKIAAAARAERFDKALMHGLK